MTTTSSRSSSPSSAKYSKKSPSYASTSSCGTTPAPAANPRSEDTISDWVRQRLQIRLQEAFFQREAHVSSKGEGIGTRIDI
jgi:hypothetical protein